MDKVAQEKTDPQPAVGQVWQARKHERVVNEIERIDGHAVVWTHGGWDDILSLRGFHRCIGISTPAGRVMVGERRHAPDGRALTMTRIMGGGYVGLSVFDTEVGTNAAESVVSWPLLPPAPAPQGETEATWSPTIAWDPAAVTPDMLRSDGEIRRPTKSSAYATLADMTAPLSQDDVRRLADTLRVTWTPKQDPLADREQRRREIDAVLREDARRFPAFATARRCAVLAVEERAPDTNAGDARSILAECHAYEFHGRDGKRAPSAHALAVNKGRVPLDGLAIVHYERARALP